LVRKDLKLFLVDRRAVVMGVVAPIVIASFFGYIFGGGAGNADNGRIPIRVVDQDGSAFTGEIVRRLEADRSLDVKPATAEQALNAVRRGKATAAVVLPKNLGRDLAGAFLTGGKKPEIGLRFDPMHNMERRMVQGIVTGAVMEAVGKQIGGQDAGLQLPFRVGPEQVGVRYNGYAHSFGGMGIQFLLMVGVEVGVNLLLRRQQGVWKRMRAAPLSRGVLLGSRVASSAITSMGTLLVLFGFARVVFGVRIEGSLPGFVGICAAFSLMTTAFGLLIASLGKTADATRALAILGTLFLVMLGGAWVPTFVFPRWLQAMTVVIPTRWAMDGLDAVTWRGLGFSAVAPQVSLLLGCAVVVGSLAVWRFRWEVD
jgi:ABC-2 type transport system permease protein